MIRSIQHRWAARRIRWIHSGGVDDSVALVALLMVLLVEMAGTTQRIWVDGRNKAAGFRESRAAFESMSRQIAQATLNTTGTMTIPPSPPNISDSQTSILSPAGVEPHEPGGPGTHSRDLLSRAHRYE
ncbi:MAG: hypothetical protein WDN28_21335 [Chthoniobacter sp.]